MCNCKEKIVLFAPNIAFRAQEEWCPFHGYQNDCYLCNTDPGALGTELCLKHVIERSKGE